MSIFYGIPREKVVSLHKFLRLLRRLGACGKVFTTTVSADKLVPVSAMDFTNRDYKTLLYSVRYDGYDPSRYEMYLEMELEKVFGNRMSTDPWFTHFKF